MRILIDEVRKRRILWDRSCSYYKEKFEADHEWMKIARKCRILKEVAKKKWRNLRDQFIKELKKIPKGTSTKKCAAIYPGKWKYFTSLLFLRDTITVQNTEENSPTKPDVALMEVLMEPPYSSEEGKIEIDNMNSYRDSPKINVLINEVHKRDFLWDKTCIRYKDKIAADHEWNQVAIKCGLLKESTKTKWRNLRDQFSKELKRVPTEAAGDPELCVLNYPGKWQHFESLIFLLDTLTPKYKEENVSNMHEIALTEELIEMPSSDEMENDEHNYMNESNADATHISRIGKYENVLDIDIKNFKFWETEENENSLFLKSLLPYFGKLNAIQQLRVRSKFQNILIEELQNSLRYN